SYDFFVDDLDEVKRERTRNILGKKKVSSKFLQPGSSDEEDFSLANPPAVPVFNESDGNSPLPAFPSASINTQVPLHLNDDGSQIQFVAANDGNV
ncbi:unnamed protein product, partial [Allacma fusca]